MHDRSKRERGGPWHCMGSVILKFELTNQHSAGGKNSVVTHLFGTSKFICSRTHPPLLFSGLGPLFLLFILLFPRPILLNITRGAWHLEKLDCHKVMCMLVVNELSSGRYLCFFFFYLLCNTYFDIFPAYFWSSPVHQH